MFHHCTDVSFGKKNLLINSDALSAKIKHMAKFPSVQYLFYVLTLLDFASNRSWPSTLRWLRRHDHFDRHFVILPEERRWCDLDFLESSNEHIPFDLLDGNDAEAVYRNHVNALRVEYKRTE